MQKEWQRCKRKLNTCTLTVSIGSYTSVLPPLACFSFEKSSNVPSRNGCGKDLKSWNSMFFTAMDWIHYKPVWTQLNPRKSLFIVNWCHFGFHCVYSIFGRWVPVHTDTHAQATRINNLTHDVYCRIYKIFLIPELKRNMTPNEENTFTKVEYSKLQIKL